MRNPTPPKSNDQHDPISLEVVPHNGGFERVQIKNAPEQVVERLVTAIALGNYLPGQKFPPERELAERLGVSRATLRAAMHRLADDGYVTIKRGREGGAQVNASWNRRSPQLIRRTLDPYWQRIEALFDVGREVEMLIARLAAERRRRDDLVAIRRAVRAYARATDRNAMSDADHDLDAAIAAATRNPYLVTLLLQVRSQLTLGTDTWPFSPEIREQALREHDLLYASIEARDGIAAAQVAYRHFVDLVEMPLRTLYERVHRKRSDD